MMRLWKICWALAFSVVVVSTGAASTFLIETRISASQEDLEGDEKMRVIGIESGIMDTLFENGHIFFNVYSSPDERGNRPPVGRTIALADETGADYLVELIPDEVGVAWRLRTVSEPDSVHRDYENLSQVDDEPADGERWEALGTILGGRVMDILAGD